MTTTRGTFNYRTEEKWGRGPAGRELGVINGVAVDSQDRVFIATRKPVPCVVIFDPDGCFLRSWGEDVFVKVGGIHGIKIDRNDHLFITDWLDHTVHKLTAEGKLLMTLGTRGQKGESGKPFNGPTMAVAGPTGEIFVSDGYGQSRIHRFSSDGAWICSWGAPGSGAGEFDTPHGLHVDRLNRVLVADRGNNRVQVFDVQGQFLEEWPASSPADIYIDPDDHIFAGRSIFNLDGKELVESADIRCHALCGDSAGNLYWTMPGAQDENGRFVETANLMKKLVRM
jgi:DNA-binding beta-propeller fold protein YncE